MTINDVDTILLLKMMVLLGIIIYIEIVNIIVV